MNSLHLRSLYQETNLSVKLSLPEIINLQNIISAKKKKTKSELQQSFCIVLPSWWANTYWEDNADVNLYVLSLNIHLQLSCFPISEDTGRKPGLWPDNIKKMSETLLQVSSGPLSGQHNLITSFHFSRHEYLAPLNTILGTWDYIIMLSSKQIIRYSYDTFLLSEL